MTNAPLNTNITNTVLENITSLSTFVRNEDEIMGQKHNRKRIRHRPTSRSREQFPTQRASPQTSIVDTSLLSTRAMRHHNQQKYPACTPLSLPYSGQTTGMHVKVPPPRFFKQESAASRDRRIFGGVEEDTASAQDLKGAMLDVVLGLFDGVDYDDSMC